MFVFSLLLSSPSSPSCPSFLHPFHSNLVFHCLSFQAHQLHFIPESRWSLKSKIFSRACIICQRVIVCLFLFSWRSSLIPISTSAFLKLRLVCFCRYYIFIPLHRTLYIPFIFDNKSYTGRNLECKVNGRHQEEDLVSGSHVFLIEPENKIMGSDG